MTKTRLLIAATLLAACDTKPAHNDSVEAPVRDVNGAAPANDAAAAPADTGNFSASASGPADHAIPVAFHGRWGMVPGDCGPDASIAKGLMVVDAQKLRFYESVGTPAVVTWPTPSRMEGSFTFSGEGMEWRKDMILSIEGDKLVRTEKDPAASYSYSRCKS